MYFGKLFWYLTKCILTNYFDEIINYFDQFRPSFDFVNNVQFNK